MATPFGHKIRNARKALGMTQKELADKVNATNTSVSNWENDLNKPDPDTIELICGALDITPNYLLSMNEDPPARSFDYHTIPNLAPPPKTYRVPRLGLIACGGPILANQNTEDYDDVPEYFQCDFTLQCQGDSMTGARINDGDIVFVREQPAVENGEIAAVIIDHCEGDDRSAATLKKFYSYPGQIILYPANPMYDPLVYVGEEMNNVRILGRVVGFMSQL